MPNPEQGFRPYLTKEDRHEGYDPRIVGESIQSDLGLSIEQLAPLAPERLGDNSIVFTGQLDGRDVVVKLGNDAKEFAVEDAVFRLFAENNIPGPQSIALKEKLTGFEKAVIIETHAEGTPLAQLPPEKVTPEIIRDAGRVMHTLHQIRLEGYGMLRFDAGHLHGASPVFIPEEYVPDFSFLTQEGYITEEERAIIEKAREDIVAGYTKEPVFVHGDYSEAHVFTDGTRVTGIIDVGGALSADPRYDIAKTHFFLPSSQHADFDAGYGDLTHDPLLKRYELYVAARKVIFRHRQGYMHRIPGAIEVLRRSLQENA